jgi:hypothetical protein
MQENTMRHPFHMDHLSAGDKQAVRRFYGRMLAFYCSVLLIAAVAVKLSADDRQTNRFNAVPSAVAGEQAGPAECAARDLKLLTSIERHGEAQDVPADDLVAAFFTLAKARTACTAGDSGAALAIYDSIAIAPTRSAKK